MAKHMDGGKFFDETTKTYAWKHGFTFEEIAILMGENEGTIKITFARALKKLRRFAATKNMELLV